MEKVWVKSAGDNYLVHQCEVVKKTPTGQVVVKIHGEHTMRFDKGGYEMDTGSRYYRARIVTEEEANGYKDRDQKRKDIYSMKCRLEKATGFIGREYVSFEIIEELEQILVEAKRLANPKSE